MRRAVKIVEIWVEMSEIGSSLINRYLSANFFRNINITDLDENLFGR